MALDKTNGPGIYPRDDVNTPLDLKFQWRRKHEPRENEQKRSNAQHAPYVVSDHCPSCSPLPSMLLCALPFISAFRFLFLNVNQNSAYTSLGSRKAV
jgi:hypothetical protein